MSLPARWIAPECGGSCPVNWLISVVLPAPLGPMIACNSPRAMSSVTLAVATMPSNRRTRFSTRSKGSATAQPPQKSDNAAVPEQHDAVQQLPVADMLSLIFDCRRSRVNLRAGAKQLADCGNG